MAELAEFAARLDYYLDYLERCFDALEEHERQWATLSHEDRSDFLLAWPAVEDKLEALDELVDRFGVPADRRYRYDMLQARIVRGRLVLEGLRERA